LAVLRLMTNSNLVSIPAGNLRASTRRDRIRNTGHGTCEKPRFHVTSARLEFETASNWPQVRPRFWQHCVNATRARRALHPVTKPPDDGRTVQEKFDALLRDMLAAGAIAVVPEVQSAPNQQMPLLGVTNKPNGDGRSTAERLDALPRRAAAEAGLTAH
jgi:hypothetical protein